MPRQQPEIFPIPDNNLLYNRNTTPIWKLSETVATSEHASYIPERIKAANESSLYVFSSSTGILTAIYSTDSGTAWTMMITSTVRDIWTHALFLVQTAYDWQYALIQFQSLEKEASTSQIRAILLLNIGITQTLLAEYKQAEQTFRKVLSMHPFISPLAHFLLGLVRFENADYRQSQMSFSLCASILNQTAPRRDYRSLGLDFILCRDQVIENEKIAAQEWTLDQQSGAGHQLLNRLPALSIFDSTSLSGFEGGGPRTPLCRYALAGSGPRSTTMQATAVAAASQIPEQQALPKLNDHVQKKPVRRSPLVPRDAHIEPANLRLLAHFLRYTGPDTLVDNNMSNNSASRSKPSVAQTLINPSKVVGLLRKFSVVKPSSPPRTSMESHPIFSKTGG